jgi:hypothetical protein
MVVQSLLIGNPELASSGKIAVASTVCAFAAATTGVLHWATKGYVRTLSMEDIDYQLMVAQTHPNPKGIKVGCLTSCSLGIAHPSSV